MSTPVRTNKWSGNFDCDFCRRKRLMADCFSKKALEKYRKSGGKLKCKECVAKLEEEERAAAAAKRQQTQRQQQQQRGQDDSTAVPNQGQRQEETRSCASCHKELSSDSYNKNQWSKGIGKSKCRTCVEEMISNEQQYQQRTKEDKIRAAIDKVEELKSNGASQTEIVQAESELAALEAEKVTGLKPIKMNARGGDGRGRGGRTGGRGGRGRLSRG